MPDDPLTVCFDMDGVLVDSETHWHAAERDRIFPAAIAGDHPALDEVTGMHYREIYHYLDDNYEVTLSEAEFTGLYEAAAEELYSEAVDLLPGVRETLTALDDRGVQRAVVSSSPVAWIDTVLDRFDVPFESVYSADEFDGPGKPEPGVYEDAIADLGTTPERTVVVEDSVNGVQSASRAGTTVIAYRGDHDTEPDGDGLAPADTVVQTPAALHETVLETVDRVGGA
ncbi:MAG: haloacid dehalogenase superfamily, subfamily IA, variant 3 with third motif having DD or ED [halophilic archaeon J07HB67]|nr:MAG: haloacid dehalogenase superfamily, subfamily IA, variant 3 with third motif having DD or ED [halophilic archaeon J07HB67]